ncbi:MAG: hypothetical protein IPM29_11515 [Planctomycetes bacterium]|nr:hypothetical protein [Planctomycetota bacterium]
MIPIFTQLALAALSAMPNGGEPANLNAYYETARGGLQLTAELSGATGPVFVLLARTHPADPNPAFIDFYPLDQTGYGRARLFVPGSLIADLNRLGVKIYLSSAYLDAAGIVETSPADLALGASLATTKLDFNCTIGSDATMVAGRVIHAQWHDIGMMVEAVNNRPTGPQLPILFDTAHPTGGDWDLMTPNPAAYNNTVPYGKVLIIAENSIDANGDGLIDDPDDEAAGGCLRFDFAHPATISSVTLIDVDEPPGTELRFFRNGNLTVPDETIPIVSLGDGSVQTVTFMEEGIDRFEVYLRGSGALAGVDVSTCPTLLAFDETSTGVPRNLPAGTWMQNQITDMPVAIQATNNVLTHPQKGILFDTANPTGGDWDLLTPNPNAWGNTEPLGMVLIVAENDIDLNGDGLVDDPDDEEFGGTLTVEWPYDVFFHSAYVLDIDSNEVTWLRLYDAAGLQISATRIFPMGDGSVQLIQPDVAHVRRLVLELGGSGALGKMLFCAE